MKRYEIDTIVIKRSDILLQQTYRVFLSGTDYQATGEYNIESGQLTVHEGSKIKMTENPSFRIDYPNIATMKDNLVKQGIIVDNEFTKNYEFNDVFHASTKIGRASCRERV